MKSLSAQAQKIITDYLSLPFPDKNVNCPYFNNQRSKVRAALRVLVGKGTPTEITEEASLIALREKIDLKNISDTDLKMFLVEQNLGIDCSALAYYILDEEAKVRGFGSLKKHLRFSAIKNPLRKLLTRLRPVENTSVMTLSDDANSVVVNLSDMQPGDLIVLLKTREDHQLNHVLIITETSPNPSLEKEGQDTPSPNKEDRRGETNFPLLSKEGPGEVLRYVHSFRWTKEGKYDHGVRQGTITITDVVKPLSEQRWEEKNITGDENETLRHVKLAEKVEIRRLHIFS